MERMLTRPRPSNAARINLVQRYPLSLLRDFRKTTTPLVLCLGLAALTLGLRLGLVRTNSNSQIFILVQPWLNYLCLGVGLICLVHFLYHMLARKTLYYGINDGHLVISRGIILKKRGLFPLSRITDVYLERSALDLVYGLHTLRISTPTLLSERFAQIDGLDARTAMRLQCELARLLERDALGLGEEVRAPEARTAVFRPERFEQFAAAA